jgi:hypothetical protein
MSGIKDELARILGVGGRPLLGRRARWRRAAVRALPGGRLGYMAGELGRSMVAGLTGTAAITAASATEQIVKDAIEARKRGERPSLSLGKAIAGPWLFSADVVGKILGVTPKDDEAKRRLSIATHWTYGMAWGASLAALEAVGVRGPLAVGALLAGVLGAEMLAMPALHLFPPPSQWGRKAVISSTYQHAIYAAAAGLAFRRLHRGGALRVG